jgi:acetoin utilization protein AcuB
MTRNPITVPPEQDLRQTLALMQEAKVRRLPVEDRGRLVGIVTEKDITERCAGKLTCLRLAEIEDLLGHMKVSGVMSLEPTVVSPEDSLITAAKTMEEKRIGALPVVLEGKLIGMITKSDLVRGLVSGIEGNGSPPK